jgi:plastocyanin
LECLGGPPPRPGQTVVKISASDYSYGFDRSQAASGDFAINFVNTGKDAHEITMFRAPEGATVPQAGAALGDVNGSELSNIPAPYELVDHITFAPPGKSTNFQFTKRLAPGHYVIACYLPQGTKSESDLRTNTTGKPHIQLGMIADFEVQ